MPLDAVFSIASMTKPMVAVGALELYEQGLLKLDEPVATYLPQLAKVQVAVLKQNDGGAAGYDLAAPVRAPNVTDLMRHTSGWAYGGRGTTGARSELSPALAGLVTRARTQTELPLYAGFGISTPEHARAAARLADGIVVGSRAVEVAEDGPAALRDYVSSLRVALDA